MKINNTKLLISIFVCLCGCATKPYRPGNFAELVISDNYNFVKSRRIAILPFIVSGEKESTRYTESDKFSTKLMKMGFTVVERALLEQVFSELKLSLTGAISPDKLKQIGGMLSVDMIVFGSVQFQIGHPPGRNFRERFRQGVRESRPGYFALEEKRLYMEGVSVRMIDVATGEVMISAFCDNSRIPYERDMIEEIAESIRRAL